MKHKIGKIDTLVTQFSYASWWGNKDDGPAWNTAAAEQLEKIRREVEVLEPAFVLLSASYVFFDHEENWYMNQWMNTVHKAFEYISQLPGTAPVALYPGDKWLAGTEHNSSSALARYAADQDRVLVRGPQHKSKRVERAPLEEAARDFICRLRRRNSLLLLLRVPTTHIFLTDYGENFSFSLRGLTPAKRSPTDVSLSSSALLYCLKNDWGGETLFINGRFEVPKGGDWGRFSRWFSIAGANRHGRFYDLAYYTKKLSRLLKRAS